MSTFRHIQPASIGRFEKAAQFFKVEDGIAYGWAIVCTENGQPYWDLQNDHIPEDEMMAAATDFMKHSRVGSDQHTGEHVGDIVFAMPVTKANADTFGITTKKTGLLIGYQPQDPVHLDMIARGERTGFSIGGYLLDYDVEDIGKAVWSTAYQNNLPDSSFAYVKPGGKKDDDGKTVPRSNRMFPYKDKDGNLDEAHVDNGLSRLASAKLDESIKAKIKSKLEAAKAKLSKGVAKFAKDGSPDASDVYTPSEVGTQGKKKPKGKVYRRFKIDEISLVTKPAQEGATVSFVKGAVVAKADYDLVFTSSDDGHQHIVDVDDYDEDGRGCTSYAITADGEFHSHTWLRKDDGAIDIGDNAGHGHSVDATSPDQPDPADLAADDDEDMTSPVQGGDFVVIARSAPTENSTAGSPSRSVASKSQENTMTPEQQIADLNKRLARSEKMLELSDAHRAYAKALSGEALDAFLAKTPAERGELAKGAVAYKAEDGTLYFAHDDARVIAMAKSNDEMAKRLIVEEKLRKEAQYAAIAKADMNHLAGDEPMHVAVVAAVSQIADEKVRTAALDMIKSANVAFSKLEKPRGSTGVIDSVQGGGEVTPYEKAQTDFKTAVEAYQKANNLASYEVAFAEATLKDQKVRELYGQIVEMRQSN